MPLRRRHGSKKQYEPPAGRGYNQAVPAKASPPMATAIMAMAINHQASATAPNASATPLMRYKIDSVEASRGLYPIRRGGSLRFMLDVLNRGSRITKRGGGYRPWSMIITDLILTNSLMPKPPCSRP